LGRASCPCHLQGAAEPTKIHTEKQGSSALCAGTTAAAGVLLTRFGASFMPLPPTSPAPPQTAAAACINSCCRTTAVTTVAISHPLCDQLDALATFKPLQLYREQGKSALHAGTTAAGVSLTRFVASFMPLPPPPDTAFTSSGKPTDSASASSLQQRQQQRRQQQQPP
jgi:hypothetical protein